MKKRQLGVSLSGLMVAAVILAVFALLGMKIGPQYLEFSQIKKAIKTVAADPNVKGSVSEVRKAYERITIVDNISSVSAQDLEITKEGGGIVIAFSYEKRIPLFANVGIVIDFQGSSTE